MRKVLFAVAGVFMVCGPVAAQQSQPPAGPPADPLAQQRLDALLSRWESAMKAIDSLVAQCNRTTVNKTFQTKDDFEGSASFLRPNMARLEMRKKGDPNKFELFVCAGNKVYEYVPQNRVIRVHEMPPPELAIPVSSLPSVRSNAGSHGTRKKSRALAISAKPLMPAPPIPTKGNRREDQPSALTRTGVARSPRAI